MTLAATPIPDADLDGFCGLKGPAELTAGAVRLHAPDLLLVDQDDGSRTPAARASLWWQAVPQAGTERLGLIGHYAARDEAAGTRVLAFACRTLAGLGCTLAVAPIDGSTWRRYRVLTQRGSEPPFFLEPDNPDDWPRSFEAAGFAPLARYYSSVNEDNARGGRDLEASSRCEQAGYRFRPFNAADPARELALLWQLSCEAFKDNFLYSAITQAEFLDMYAPLLAVAPTQLIRIAEWDGAPVAFCLALPNLLQSARGHRVDTVIGKSMATLPAHRHRGLGGALLSQVNRSARALGMTRTIHALMHENNPSRRLYRDVMRDFRVYTLYGCRL